MPNEGNYAVFVNRLFHAGTVSKICIKLGTLITLRLRRGDGVWSGNNQIIDLRQHNCFLDLVALRTGSCYVTFTVGDDVVLAIMVTVVPA